MTSIANALLLVACPVLAASLLLCPHQYWSLTMVYFSLVPRYIRYLTHLLLLLLLLLVADCCRFGWHDHVSYAPMHADRQGIVKSCIQGCGRDFRSVSILGKYIMLDPIPCETIFHADNLTKSSLMLVLFFRTYLFLTEKIHVLPESTYPLFRSSMVHAIVSPDIAGSVAPDKSCPVPWGYAHMRDRSFCGWLRKRFGDFVSTS